MSDKSADTVAVKCSIVFVFSNTFVACEWQLACLPSSFNCLTDLTLLWSLDSSLVAVLLFTYSVFEKFEITGLISCVEKGNELEFECVQNS